MADLYSTFHSLALVFALGSSVAVSIWGRWAMFRMRTTGHNDETMNKVGFAFRCLLYVPLLLILVFVPAFVCSDESCQPGDFGNAGLTLSIICGLLASALWIVTQWRRSFKVHADRIFEPFVLRNEILTRTTAFVALAALVLMATNLPS